MLRNFLIGNSLTLTIFSNGGKYSRTFSQLIIHKPLALIHKKLIKKLIYIFTFVLITSCLSDRQLKEGWWKYGEGYHIGDVISFERYDLRNDTLFLENTPRALLSRREGSIFGMKARTIIIKDLNSNETGTYYQKGVSE